MLTIAIKELMELLYSPKYLFIFIGALLIIGFAFINGYVNYSEELDRVEFDKAQNQQSLEESLGYPRIYVSLFRKPSPLSIIDSGVTFATGVRSGLSANISDSAALGNLFMIGGDSLGGSRYSNNPGLALFKELDITQTVLFLFSLFAILLSHNAISGEKENGTLKLIHANSLSRATVLFGKAIGGFIPLLVALVIPFLLGLLILTGLTEISFSGEEWLSIGLLLFLYILYVLFFFLIGLAASVFTKTSFISFLTTLMIWVTIVIVIPRMSVEVAAMLKPPIPQQVLNRQVSRATSNLIQEYRLKTFEAINEAKMTWAEIRKTPPQELWSKFDKERDEKTQQVTQKLKDEFERRKAENSAVLEVISKLSPASLLKFTTGRIAGSDIHINQSFQEAKMVYRPGFVEKAKVEHLKLAKQLEEYQRNAARYKVEKSADGYVHAYLVGNADLLPPQGNAEALPRFPGIQVNALKSLELSIFDFTLLIFLSIILFVISLVAYRRYDVR